MLPLTCFFRLTDWEIAFSPAAGFQEVKHKSQCLSFEWMSPLWSFGDVDVDMVSGCRRASHENGDSTGGMSNHLTCCHLFL